MNWRKNLWVLWVACVISSSSYTMLIPFLPLYLINLGAPKSTIGLWSGFILSATFFVSTIMSPFWGRWADKSGKRSMLLRAGYSLALVYFIGAFVRSPLQLFLVRLLQGFATGFVPAALAIVSSTVPEEKMGSSLGLVQNAVLVGTIIGPVFGGGLSHIFGIRASFVVASIIMFIGTVLVKTLVKEPNQVKSAHLEEEINLFIIALNNKAFLEMLILLFIAQMGIMALQPLISLHLAELQGGLQGTDLTAGLVFGLMGIAGAIAAPIWGKAGQRVGFIKILIIGFSGAGLFNSIVFVSKDIWSFTLLQFVFGVFIAGINPSVNTVAVMNTDANLRGRIFGFLMSANQFGSMTGPLIGGIIAVWIGINQIFLFTGLFFILIGLLLWKRHYLSEKSISDEFSSSNSM